VIYPALRIWQEKPNGAPVPFAAVRTPRTHAGVGCDLVVDIWRIDEVGKISGTIAYITDAACAEPLGIPMQ
jgi:hypothetical protein